MKEDTKKNLAVGMLVAAICIMSVGYAVLAQQLTVTGTAEITGEWDIHLENLQMTSKTDTAVADTAPVVSTTNVSFNVELLQPGDSITYTVDIVNDGTIDAKLDTLTVTPQAVADGVSSQIEWTFSGIAQNEVIAAGASKTVTMTATIPSTETTVTKDLSRNMTVVFDFSQKN